MKRLVLFALISFALAYTSLSLNAQCALCKRNAETSLEEGNTQAKGLNLGIMYLLVVPYALVGGIGYWWYRQRKKADSEEQG